MLSYCTDIMETHQTLDSTGSSNFNYRLSPRPEELACLEVARECLAGLKHPAAIQPIRILSVSTGRGQAAESVARESVNLPYRIECDLWYIDQFHQQRSQQHCGLANVQTEDGTSKVVTVELPSNLNFHCLADAPEIEADLAIVPLTHQGEQELSRDFLQQCFHRLKIGGSLIAAVDNAKDSWLHDQLKVFEKSVRVRPFANARGYRIEKTKPLKKLKDFSCDLAYRDCDELIHLITRPGVFSHRQLDNGARQLLDAVDVYPGASLIDIGCGSGSVAIGLAARDPNAKIHAVDSNARAIWCVEQGSKKNKLKNITTELNANGDYINPGTFDMALANPPYFGDFQIAEKLIVAALRSLRPGGRLVLVSKQPSWYEENLPRWFEECEVFPSGRYHIASGVKPKPVA
ncbi:MAG: Ribosomal small subunit methyltransferase [Planctomycetota bacterium]